MAQLPLSTAIYQLRLVLAAISPMIWRRLLVSSETTIAQLHQYIQVAFNWSGEPVAEARCKNYCREAPVGKNFGPPNHFANAALSVADPLPPSASPCTHAT